ncbi:restriction endonuclease subunit S [Clostridium sp. E02]|uniref:restriction endonuclease subunit S n=1 Tax=Clostridium sp. E02 TaxID=2487134 RepID=UPI0013DE1AF3|nr:restriction endonuclease subunit S [Clostridium sp. E02]
MRRELGRHIKEYKQRNKSLQCNKVFSVTNSEGFIPSTEYFSKEVFSKDLSAYKVVKKGMIAFNPSRINVGSVANLEVEDEVVISPLYTVFQTDETLNAKFLTYFLKSNLGNQQIRSLTSGSVRDTLKYSALEKILIPSISVQEQNNLVKQLDLLTKLIELREEELEQLDNLIKSRFVEMFGDPLKNNKGFVTKEGKSLFKISNGKAVPDKKRFDTGIPAYGGNGISWYTDEVLFESDTVVIGRVGFQSGNVHLVKGPLWITDNAMYISDLYGDDLNLVFLSVMMEQIDFTRYQDAGDLKKVTQKPFIEMSYIVPPIPLQNEYTSFINQVDKLKFEIQKSLDETQELFDSLMQEYFE